MKPTRGRGRCSIIENEANSSRSGLGSGIGRGLGSGRGRGQTWGRPVGSIGFKEILKEITYESKEDRQTILRRAE